MHLKFYYSSRIEGIRICSIEFVNRLLMTETVVSIHFKITYVVKQNEKWSRSNLVRFDWEIILVGQYKIFERGNILVTNVHDIISRLKAKFNVF